MMVACRSRKGFGPVGLEAVGLRAVQVVDYERAGSVVGGSVLLTVPCDRDLDRMIVGTEAIMELPVVPGLFSVTQFGMNQRQVVMRGLVFGVDL